MITAIIQARMGSTRLPGKVLMEVNGRPLLDYMLERLRRSRRLEQIIIATTRSSGDDRIALWCREHNVSVYRGEEEDVLARYAGAARVFGATVVARMTSDCPLIDPRVADRVITAHLEQADPEAFTANTVPLPCLYPDGMDVEVFSAELLARADREARLPSEREHVTFYFWKTGRFPVRRLDPPQDWSRYRFTVDYPQDFTVIRTVLTDLYPRQPDFSMEDLIAFMEAHPHLQSLQAGIARNAGWARALARDAEVEAEGRTAL